MDQYAGVKEDREGRYADTEEYVTAFERSSNRARYALYIVVVTTVLVGIANYNVQDWSWPRKRLSAWYKYATPTSPQSEVAPFFGGNIEQLKEARQEYLRQFVDRSVFTESPIPGVSMDINDVGLYGGLALTLLMLVQAICIMREHENLTWLYTKFDASAKLT